MAIGNKKYKNGERRDMDILKKNEKEKRKRYR